MPSFFEAVPRATSIVHQAICIMNKVRWGVLSTARIGMFKVIPGMQQCAHAEVTAIASRSQESAQAAADSLGIAKAHASYEALLADPEIDAVYIPLPNQMHVPWAIKAIHQGKHVLCEKPIGLSSAEGRELLEAARANPHLKVMEAFMYRHHPQWVKARELATNGSIGEVVSIQTWFSYYNDNPNDIRNQVDAGGGSLMDIGCYPISLSRFIFDAEPHKVLGHVTLDPEYQTDTVTSAILDFGEVTSSFTCSTKSAPHQRVNLVGTNGRVELEIPFNAPPDKPCVIWHHENQNSRRIELPIADQYTIQGELMSRAILEDTPVPTPLTDAVANMEVIEAIFQSARSGNWENVQETVRVG